jgi:RNA polymerase nonessential primary-like sigma factor
LIERRRSGEEGISVAGALVAKRFFEYGPDLEPQSVETIASEQELKPTYIRALLKAHVAKLAGTQIAEDDPYVAAAVEFVAEKSGTKRAPSRKQLLGRLAATGAKPDQEPGRQSRTKRMQELEAGAEPTIFDEYSGSTDLDAEAPTADLLRIYLNRIGKTKLLNAEEEVDLAKRIEAGVYAGVKLQSAAEDGQQIDAQLRRDLGWILRDGQKAKDHLMEANLRLVVSLAKRYTGRGMALLDLIQEGNLGLVRAVEKFDYTKGFKFSTYATWWIRQSITRSMADQGRTIRLPVHMVEQVNKAARIKRDLNVQLGRDATPAEVAEEMGVDESKVQDLLDHDRPMLSLDQTVGDDGEARLGSFIRDEDASEAFDIVVARMRHEAIERVLETFDAREGDIIRMRFGLDDGRAKTLEEISKKYGVVRERIRQIERETMSKLRMGGRADELRDYA